LSRTAKQGPKARQEEQQVIRYTWINRGVE